MSLEDSDMTFTVLCRIAPSLSLVAVAGAAEC